MSINKDRGKCAKILAERIVWMEHCQMGVLYEHILLKKMKPKENNIWPVQVPQGLQNSLGSKSHENSDMSFVREQNNIAAGV